jgi:hypothetical protein
MWVPAYDAAVFCAAVRLAAETGERPPPVSATYMLPALKWTRVASAEVLMRRPFDAGFVAFLEL